MNNAETQYLEILQRILNGTVKKDRTGTGTVSLFGEVIKHDYKLGFPLLTTKRVFYKAIIHELLWFLKGTESAQYLIDNKIRIWDEWLQKNSQGEAVLPHTYGVKWRNFDGVDQIQYVINEIKENPYSRRLVVSAWDARHVKTAALTWCHVLFQFNITPEQDKAKDQQKDDGKLGDIDISVYQRSADWFLGVPFNLASYSCLLYMIGEITNYRPNQMTYTFGNSHVYLNHLEQCNIQLSRKPKNLPSLSLNHKDDIDSFTYEDFKIENYEYHPSLVGKVSI